jgi:hypothetical protein
VCSEELERDRGLEPSAADGSGGESEVPDKPGNDERNQSRKTHVLFLAKQRTVSE